MIALNNVTSEIKAASLKVTVLRTVTAAIPTDRRFVILGHYGQGKSTLIKLLAGLVEPNSGSIRRYARVSFPVGYGGGLKPKLTTKQNVSYVAELYGADPKEVIPFVDQVADLGEFWDEPLKKMPPAHKMRLCFSLSYAIPFDVYLVDNVMGFGDPDFKLKCEAMLEARVQQNSGYIFATRHARLAARYGDCAGIIHKGRLMIFDRVEDALDTYDRLGSEPADEIVPEDEPVDESFNEPEEA